MALQEPVHAPTRLAAGRRIAPFGYAALGLIVTLWAYRAFRDSATHDAGLAYVGGQVAWATGHPEHWFSWTGTPFLASVYALLTRILSNRAAADFLTAINVVLVVGTIAIVLRRLRAVLSPTWWWILAFALACFGPVMSTVWWKQVNIICLVLALAGFEALRRGREHRGALLIALSLSVKPLAILLPFVLLAGRQTRRAGAWAFAYLVALNIGAQVLLAAHAHDSSALNIWLAVKNFSTKSKPAAGLACSPENFSPQSMLCRLSSPQHWTSVQVVALLGVAVLGVWIVVALRGRRSTSWEVFAYTCAVSTMVSPISWSHYQIMLAPLFVLLLVRFARGRADVGEWVGLACAFVLASLVWSPYGAVTDALQGKFSDAFRFNSHPLITAVAEFAQYVLIVTALLWETRRRRTNEAGPAV
jgi:Glycosyltransferase family 87